VSVGGSSAKGEESKEKLEKMSGEDKEIVP